MGLSGKDARAKTASRDKLIDAAIAVFSAKGYGSASTRDIAAAAGVNHAAISYYFSGKEPLYAACIDKIVEGARAEIGDALARIDYKMSASQVAETQSWALLDEYIETMVPFFASCRHEVETSNIVMRELLEPSPAFDRLYEGMMRNLLETLALLIARLTGLKPKSRKIVICSHAVLGQMIGFKNGHAVVARSLGIADFTDKDIRDFTSVIKKNTRGIIAAWRKP